MNKNNKGTLILIIVLLVIFSGLSVWGYIANSMGVNKPPEPENINREFKFNNKLYFYDKLALIGTYDCKSQNCDYAQATIDDVDYSLNYYKEAKESKISMINNKYAFIIDDSKEIILYDIPNKSIVNKFKAVKDYEIGIKDNYYIVKNTDNKWGVIKLESNLELIVDYKYEFIGLNKNIDSESKKVDNSIFAIKDSNGWKLISNTNLDKSAYSLNQIYDYNDKYIITSNNNYYYVNNVSSGSPISSNIYSYANFIGNYIAVINNTKEFYIFNPDTLQVISQKYPVTSINDVKLEESLSGISISIKDEYKEMVK